MIGWGRKTGDRRPETGGRRRYGEGHFELGPSDAQGSERLTTEGEQESMVVNSECFDE